MNSRPATSATHHAFQVGKSTFGGSRQFLTRQNGTDQTRTDSDERGQLRLDQVRVPRDAGEMTSSV
jgi:hypothetical protein